MAAVGANSNGVGQGKAATSEGGEAAAVDGGEDGRSSISGEEWAVVSGDDVGGGELHVSESNGTKGRVHDPPEGKADAVEEKTAVTNGHGPPKGSPRPFMPTDAHTPSSTPATMTAAKSHTDNTPDTGADRLTVNGANIDGQTNSTSTRSPRSGEHSRPLSAPRMRSVHVPVAAAKSPPPPSSLANGGRGSAATEAQAQTEGRAAPVSRLSFATATPRAASSMALAAAATAGKTAMAAASAVIGGWQRSTSGGGGGGVSK